MFPSYRLIYVYTLVKIGNSELGRGCFVFNSKYFSNSIIELFSNRYDYFLQKPSLDHYSSILDIDIISDDEYKVIVNSSGKSKRKINKIALVDDSDNVDQGSLTYAEVYQYMLLIAMYLQSFNVIAVALPRGILQIIVMLGINYLSKTIVPLDLALPEDRLNYMIEDAGCDCIVMMKNNSAVES
eukprot:Pgem_evm4s19198